MQNYGKTSPGDMVNMYLFTPNLALICVTGSAKTGFTDDGRLARDNCSSAMQQNKAELKLKAQGIWRSA